MFHASILRSVIKVKQCFQVRLCIHLFQNLLKFCFILLVTLCLWVFTFNWMIASYLAKFVWRKIILNIFSYSVLQSRDCIISGIINLRAFTSNSESSRNMAIDHFLWVWNILSQWVTLLVESHVPENGFILPNLSTWLRFFVTVVRLSKIYIYFLLLVFFHLFHFFIYEVTHGTLRG